MGSLCPERSLVRRRGDVGLRLSGMENGEGKTSLGGICDRICPRPGGRREPMRRPDGQRRQLCALGNETDFTLSVASGRHVVTEKKEVTRQDA